MNNSSRSVLRGDGYDLAVYGLGNHTFYAIHIPAIICISASFVCAVIAIVLSFKKQTKQSFFTQWSKSERFVVYIAICDLLFNIAHFTDHMQIVIVKNHVFPKELCEFYGVLLAIFIMAQNLMVNVVAINAFMLIYFDKNLNFGRWDWILLTWTFGAPFVGAVIAASLGQMGPNGAFCFFDPVKSRYTQIFFTTLPLLIILAMNSVLYVLTWKRIHDQTLALKKSATSMSISMRTSHNAAKAMSLFVVAFFIQWWAMSLLGAWLIFDRNVPQAVHHFVTTLSNLGGCFNLVVYKLIKRRMLTGATLYSTRQGSNRSQTGN